MGEWLIPETEGGTSREIRPKKYASIYECANFGPCKFISSMLPLASLFTLIRVLGPFTSDLSIGLMIKKIKQWLAFNYAFCVYCSFYRVFLLSETSRLP